MAAPQQVAKGGLEPKPADMSVTAKPSVLGALSHATDSQGALLSAWLSFDLHDTIATSPSVLGYESGARFLAVSQQPGTTLTDPPIALQD